MDKEKTLQTNMLSEFIDFAKINKNDYYIVSVSSKCVIADMQRVLTHFTKNSINGCIIKDKFDIKRLNINDAIALRNELNLYIKSFEPTMKG